MSNRTGKVVENPPSVIKRLHRILSSIDLDQVEQIVLFGSASVGMDSSQSDTDILLILGQKKMNSLKIEGLDVSSITSRDRHSNWWLGSELANHIAHYGVWLKGNDDWSHKCFVSNESIDFKLRKIEARVHALDGVWTHFSPAYQRKHLRLVRRDIQRLELMLTNLPVAPAPILDSSWDNSTCKANRALTRLSPKTSHFVATNILAVH